MHSKSAGSHVPAAANCAQFLAAPHKPSPPHPQAWQSAPIVSSAHTPPLHVHPSELPTHERAQAVLEPPSIPSSPRHFIGSAPPAHDSSFPAWQVSPGFGPTPPLAPLPALPPLAPPADTPAVPPVALPPLELPAFPPLALPALPPLAPPLPAVPSLSNASLEHASASAATMTPISCLSSTLTSLQRSNARTVSVLSSLARSFAYGNRYGGSKRNASVSSPPAVSFAGTQFHATGLVCCSR
jgi:hypothetical protein